MDETERRCRLLHRRPSPSCAAGRRPSTPALIRSQPCRPIRGPMRISMTVVKSATNNDNNGHTLCLSSLTREKPIFIRDPLPLDVLCQLSPSIGRGCNNGPTQIDPSQLPIKSPPLHHPINRSPSLLLDDHIPNATAIGLTGEAHLTGSAGEETKGRHTTFSGASAKVGRRRFPVFYRCFDKISKVPGTDPYGRNYRIRLFHQVVMHSRSLG